MERESKIRMLKAIQAGLPVDLALEFKGKPIIAIKEPDGKYYINDKLTTETEVKRLKGIPGVGVILIENKTGRKLDSHCHPI